MERKLLHLRILVIFLVSAFSSSFILAGIGGDGAEKPSWKEYHDAQQLVSLHSSAYSLNLPVEWNRTYGGADSDVFFSVQQTSDGGYIAGGSTRSFGAGSYDYYLVKTNAYGDVEWNKTFGGSELDDVMSVQQTSDGGYILTGEHVVGFFDMDIPLIKMDTNGEVEWNRTYGGSSFERAWSVQQTSDGGYIIAGSTISFGAGSTDYWLIKTDAFGEMEWNRTYGGADADEAFSVQQTSDGGYFIVGDADSYKTGIFDGEIWVIKTDEYGEVEWSRISGWPDWDFAHSGQQTSDGGYIIAGTRFSSYQTRYDFWLIKLDSNGTLMWDEVYARLGANEDVSESVKQTMDGGYIVAGGLGDFWLVKTDEYGGVEWNKTFGGDHRETAYSVQQTSDGGYIVAGKTESFGLGQSGYPDGWLVKFFPTHDVAACGVEPSKAVVGENYSLSVNVTVGNPGFFTESFNVTAYVNTTDIGTQTVHNLGPESSATLTFMLNTTGFALGNYTLSAYAWPVLNETKTSDNTLVSGWMFITIPGDVDADCDVDIFDIVVMAGAYGSEEEDPAYNSIYDIDDDGDVDIFDLVIACLNYGEKWNP